MSALRQMVHVERGSTVYSEVYMFCTYVLLGIYMLVYHVPHAEHMESLIRRNGEVRSKQCRAAFRLFRS